MNLYVSNLGYDVTEPELKKLFSEYGIVNSVRIITDYNTGSSRGFAFIDMPNDSEAEKAMSKLNSKEMNSRAMSVQVARPKEDKGKKSNYTR
ncbi:MAG: RNA recognition motif domain-containing protein [Flavisolibacter sp.]|jgi:cold-inducible RNA-binding protein